MYICWKNKKWGFRSVIFFSFLSLHFRREKKWRGACFLSFPSFYCFISLLSLIFIPNEGNDFLLIFVPLPSFELQQENINVHCKIWSVMYFFSCSKWIPFRGLKFVVILLFVSSLSFSICKSDSAICKINFRVLSILKFCMLLSKPSCRIKWFLATGWLIEAWLTNRAI